MVDLTRLWYTQWWEWYIVYMCATVYPALLRKYPKVMPILKSAYALDMYWYKQWGARWGPI